MPKMIEKKTWTEFRESGLLWFINGILHVFGWAICVTTDSENGAVDENGTYPARCYFRGFDQRSSDQGYERLTNHIEESLPTMKKAFDEEYQ